MRKISTVFFILLVGVANAQTISGISGPVTNDSVVTISGSSFGTKSIPAPVVWDNLEDGTCNTLATVGTWSTVNDLSISSVNNRHSNSSYNAGINFTSEAWGNFTGGSDSPKWFVQYWFYLADDFDFGSSINDHLGNIKIFRLWSTGSSTLNNLRIVLRGSYDADLVVESTDLGHDWSPVITGHTWINSIFGHANPSYVDPGSFGWREYDIDISTGSWHLFQWEVEESTINAYDGAIKWWFDGQLILDVDDVRTRTSSQSSSFRPHTVGFYNSHGNNADGNDHFYLDDAYIDNSWARVELGNSATYNSCSHREIQVPSEWDTDSITIKVNTGSFENQEAIYLFVIDADGNVSDGYLVSNEVEGPGLPGTPIRG